LPLFCTSPPFSIINLYNLFIGEIAKEVLRGLAIGGFIVVCFVAPNIAQVMSLFKPKNYRERFRIKRTLRALQKQKLIDIREKGLTSIVTISEKGKSKVLRYNIEDLQIKPQKHWDTKWRIVMFDIPDRKRKIRREINFRLKDMGLIAYQESVFITPYECRDEIEFLG